MSSPAGDSSRTFAQTIDLPARRVPVAYDADIVVVGAGPGGFAAALKASRMGMRVIVVERFDTPGGVHTSGLQGSANVGVGGIHTELMERFAAAGYIYTATHDTLPGWAGNPLAHYERYHKPDQPFARASFNPEGAGSVMVAMLKEAGVVALYGTSFVDAVVKDGSGDGTITAIIVENASGRQAITGKIFIEGSGTAQLAAAAGVPFVRGGGPQPETAEWDGVQRPIPGGLLWIMSGINFARTVAHQKDANDPKLSKLIAEAHAAGDIPAGLYRPPMKGKGVYGDLYIGHPTLDMSPMLDDGTFILWQNVPYEWALRMDESANDDARAKSELRGFIDAEARFLRKYVPGFENAVLNNVGRFVGVRDGRHPVGEHVFSIDDARAGRKFRDAVTRPMTKPFYWDNHTKYTFEVPFRCFLPKKISNLILTGASLSFTYDTIFMVMRNFPWCTQTGEIAGFAAARCIETKVLPKELDWKAPYF
ncbi:MAG: FAD-dependent oxidoreductase [Xanthobacteraceae bacterium]